MAYRGGRKSYVVISVFILIGALIPIWIASGTVPAIVYYGIEWIKPNLFILSSFLICCLVSFLIGTSVGTSGIVGAALMVIAKSGDVNLSVTAGAIIAGAYFGDRCSPVSSSASFVAYITETNLYDNMKGMFKTSLMPFVISAAFYTVMSQRYLLHGKSNLIHDLILKEFNLNWIVLAPAIIVFIFSICKVDLKKLMLFSIVAAFIISVTVQHQTLVSCIKFMVFGFRLEEASPLHSIIKGGGIITLLKTALVVFLASAFAGILEEAGLLSNIEGVVSNVSSRYEVFRNVLITSLFGAIIGGSQTFAVMLTHMLNKKGYEKNELDNSDAAIDLENTAIMVSALVPWNVAMLTPMTILGTNSACIPYLTYIYMIPLWNLFYLKLRKNMRKS